MSDINNYKYLIALNQFPKFGQKRLKQIKKFFSSWQEGFNARPSDLIRAGINESIALEFSVARKKIEPNALLELMRKESIKAISYYDKNYPKYLKEIYNPPVLLFYKGTFPPMEGVNIAVVGTRKCSNYGKQCTEFLVRDLVANNINIISGLALGIDSIAHTSALENDGKTISVLGSGINLSSIYPTNNRYLAQKISASGGAVISELPLGAQPLRHHFPLRNRIISGLSVATLVVEAAEKSGALITSRFALEQNRDVFAVPGNIFSASSKGPNKLIKQGALAVESCEDILSALDLKQINSYINNNKIKAASKEEKIILKVLSFEPRHIDELGRLSQLETPILSSTLAMMEIKGFVKNMGGMKYILNRQ